MKTRSSVLFRFILVAALAIVAIPAVVPGNTVYQKPPKTVLDILNAPGAPQVAVSPAGDQILLVETVKYPPISELAQPMLRLAGLRINPKTNGPHRPPQVSALTLVKMADGSSSRVTLPTPGYVFLPGAPTRGGGGPGGPPPGSPAYWSADGKHIVFTNATASGIELWLLETATSRTRKIPGIVVNAAYGEPVQWMPDQRTLLVQTIPAGRAKAPAAPAVPKGPTIQENMGKKAPVWTFQDLLDNAHDEDLFDYLANAQLGTVDIATGKWAPIGKPGIFQTVDASPDGKLLLVARVHRPYSYLVTHTNFPKEVEVWDGSGAVVHKVASLSLQEQVPTDGVSTGPREYRWAATEPATLVWLEALDEGNPRSKVPHRDRILALPAPFRDQPREMTKTEFRAARLQWSEGGLLLVEESDRDTRKTRTWIVSARPGEAPRKVWDRNSQDRYTDPGSFLTRRLANGQSVARQNGDSLFLTGSGSSPEGDRPFLDQFDLKTLRSNRIYRCADKSYETILDLVAADGSTFLTRFETPAVPPNVFVRSRAGAEKRAVTRLTDPTPQIRNIRQQLVTYKRPDGVDLSFTLYLPPDYKQGERLPTVVWAYPREFTDSSSAGQVTGSPYRFTTFEGPSHLFFLTQGYAVLDNASMPVVGDAETVNDTYLDQIVASAKAAIDKAHEMGVTDRDRVGVGGHSYGAFMTANLLSNCDLFRAGIARSGAYNRTLTPFGFQQERRTIWEAPQLYFKVSPFLSVNKINTPILLIHGEADNNSGTFPVQSERYFHALKGNGKTVRYVTLPNESHGYVAKESIEHTLSEQISWFDKWVKNAAPKTKVPTGSGR